MADADLQQRRRTEGWLYRVGSKRLWLRKRYFVLQESSLQCFKSASASRIEDAIETGLIDSCIRVTDNGRESYYGRVFFVFTLYNSSNHEDRLKLGARSAEDAARWMRALKESIMQGEKHQELTGPVSATRIMSFRSASRRCAIHERNYSDLLERAGGLCPSHVHNSDDVVDSSPWLLFGCRNGLRLFQEKADGESRTRWGDTRALMAVGIVDASCEAVFETIMTLGPSRSEWDFCYRRGKLVEHLDGHSDIIHEQYHKCWFPWSPTKPRDLLLHRYWRREEDGSYVILYHSVTHMKCPPCKGFVRACLRSGGYVISPTQQKMGPRSVVKHMMAIDWKAFQFTICPSRARALNVKLLERIAALREMFKTKPEAAVCSEISLRKSSNNSSSLTDENHVKVEEMTSSTKEQTGSVPNNQSQLLHLSDSSDEFFDVPEDASTEAGESGFDQPLNEGCLDQDFLEDENALTSMPGGQSKLSTAAVLVKRLHDFATAAHKQSQVGIEVADDADRYSYEGSLPKSSVTSFSCSWCMAEPSTFLIRGKHYLQDRIKVKAKDTLMCMVAADWIASNKKEDDLAGRPTSFVQRSAASGRGEFFFVINIQVPGATTYSLALYYMLDQPLKNVPLLERFVKGDDAFRNSRIKLIPYISKGSWIVKQSVGKTACLVGQAIEVNYFHGHNYLELCLNIGSSTVAKGVVNLVLGYLSKLVIELAFLIQANTEEELPEFLIGTCKLNHLDATKAVSVKQRFGI